MNFLAHIYLSGENDQIKVGNFIGDWIKGNDYKKYPADVQKGILLHRKIDSYTDNHSIVRKSKSRLNDEYQKYSGIIIDIFYDHFLAINWKDFATTELADFTYTLNQCLVANMHYLPIDIQEFIPKFMKRRWLESYATPGGIEKVLIGMSQQTSLPDRTTEAMQILQTHYNSFKEEFFCYFPQLVKFVEDTFEIKINGPK
jgi:acyl carrier protein phosphodiesterase